MKINDGGNKILLQLAAITLISMFLGGCGIYDYWYIPPDPTTGYYENSRLLKNEEIVVNEPIDLKKYKRLLVVGIKNSSSAGTDEIGLDEGFWQKSLQGLGIFNHVVLTENLPKFFQTQMPDNQLPQNFVDLDSLSEAEKIYGDFLVMDIATYFDGQNRIIVITVIDPSDGKVYFKVKPEKLSLVDDKHNFYYPILNAFKNWAQNNGQN